VVYIDDIILTKCVIYSNVFIPKRDFTLKGMFFIHKTIMSDHNPVTQLKPDFEITVNQDKDLAKVMGISLNQLYFIYRFIYDLAGSTRAIDRNLTLTWYFIKGQCKNINIMEVNYGDALKLWRKARDHYANLVSNGQSEYVQLVNRLNADILLLNM
jgi:hypothetical protein